MHTLRWWAKAHPTFVFLIDIARRGGWVAPNNKIIKLNDIEFVTPSYPLRRIPHSSGRRMAKFHTTGYE